jgi:hypothetical protein
MISFKSFVIAIHEAIISATDTLMDKNVGLLDKYFTETPKDEKNVDTGAVNTVNTLVPKSVILEYPHLTADGTVENLEVSVPLITLVPLSMSQIEKATLTADFDIEIVDGELQLNFTNRSNNGGIFKKKHETTRAQLKITIAPQDTSEGLKLLVEGYEAILKRQIS